jgi:transcriptional regulator with XRE-family HTH domain
MTQALSGRALLRAYIRKHTTQQAFAAAIGITAPYLSQILAGHRGGKLVILARIERLTGIPLAAWVPRDDGETVKPSETFGKTANINGVKIDGCVS